MPSLIPTAPGNCPFGALPLMMRSLNCFARDVLPLGELDAGVVRTETLCVNVCCKIIHCVLWCHWNVLYKCVSVHSKTVCTVCQFCKVLVCLWNIKCLYQPQTIDSKYCYSRGHISHADFSANDLTSKSIQSFVNSLYTSYSTWACENWTPTNWMGVHVSWPRQYHQWPG